MRLLRLPLRLMQIRNILMGGDPRTAGQGFIYEGDDAAIVQLYCLGGGLSGRDIGQNLCMVPVSVAWEISQLLPVQEQAAQRSSRAYHLRTQPIHLPVPLVAQDQISLPVEHDEGLGDVVYRAIEL